MNKRALPPVAPVVLGEWGGKRAGFWIFITLIILVLLLVFLLFFLPGITKGGRYVTFNVNLSNTAVYVDGKYLGQTKGNSYFVRAGNHEAVFIKSDGEISRMDFKVSNPVFATFFIHYQQKIEVSDLKVSDTLMANARKEYFSTLTRLSATTYDEFYFIQPSISEYFSDSLILNSTTLADDYFLTLLHITGEELFEDLKKAEFLLDEAGVSYRDEDTKALRAVIEKAFSEENSTITKMDESTMAAPSKRTVSGKIYFDYEAGQYTLGTSSSASYPAAITAPVTVSVPSFSMASMMVSESDYAAFVKENPEWSASNLDSLISNGLADENYLSGINLSAPTEAPIRSVSYNAAMAYAAWYSEKTGKTFTLPTESEWEAAAALASGKTYSTSLYTVSMDSDAPSALMGGLWEFTRTPFLPYARLTNYDRAIALASELGTEDVILKGGSYINTSSQIKKETVGVFTKDRTSPYTGIRLVTEN
jgi:Uncharacterized conserved protein